MYIAADGYWSLRWFAHARVQLSQLANHEAVISPPWSIHSGCGTAAYGFIWGMAGENLVYSDMDAAPLADLR